MSETTALAAAPRDVIGKANRRLKEAGQIPAIVYGAGRESKPIALDRHEFELFMQHHGSGSALVSLKIEGENEPVDAIIKDMQMSPVKGSVLHIDFLAIKMDEVIESTAAIHFVGDAPGVKEGGVFLHDLRELMVEALPKNLPDYIEVDVSALELGHSISVSDVVAPEGVTILDDPETNVCSVTVPSQEPVEEEELEEGEMEPAVIGEEGEEGESGAGESGE